MDTLASFPPTSISSVAQNNFKTSKKFEAARKVFAVFLIYIESVLKYSQKRSNVYPLRGGLSISILIVGY